MIYPTFRFFIVARSMADAPLKDKGKGDETVHFRKEEEAQLKKLMEKIKSKEAVAKKELNAILGSHKLPDEVIQRLIDWKHG